MKRKQFLLPAAYLLCLMTAGCSGAAGKTSGSESVIPDPFSHETESSMPESSMPESSMPESSMPESSMPGSTVAAEDSEQTDFDSAGERSLADRTGRVRIPYTGIRSSAVYITSASSLPAYKELEKYNDTYFEKNALVLVTETVRSGSADVGIRSIDMTASTASVTLYHRMPPNRKGTSDMACWLLWAEVEQGLDCRWTVTNPALRSNTAAY